MHKESYLSLIANMLDWIMMVTISQLSILAPSPFFACQEMTAQDLQMIVHGVSRAETSLDAFRVQDVKSLAQLVLEART